ncbi:MAG TPA: proton-conducting transporter membrane subunit, partial [Bacteroidales bacterium]|nr:proton-conducting transporter membrane subunit [Bacteroidales bacterium]
MVFGFTLTGALALLYGVQLAKPGEQAAALIALASVIGVAFADNLITLFLFWEMLTFATAALILLKRTPEAIMSGSYFLFFHFAGGLLVLLGILQNYAVTGSFLLSEPQGGLYFFALGFGFKAAFLPLQFWVARGYPAASFTSSVILSGLTTKVGVY